MAVVDEEFARALADRYHIERELGRGGMATVYLAEDRKHRRPVAIKVLGEAAATAIGGERFMREIEFASRLTHPHILPLHDSGVAGERLYYVTPFVSGESLRARIDRERQLPIEDALRLAREVASALDYAHRQGLVHRDIKPENILLSEGGALVCDFGIARPMGEGTRPLTTAGSVIGTPAYMSPEQLMGRGDVDGRSDIYSLGCVLYEMLAGVPPFVGPAESLGYQHLSVVPHPVAEVRPTVPAGLSAAIARALAKAPSDRHPSVARFADALLDDPAPVREAPAAGRLPAERTPFVGRAAELEECARLIAETRMVTLTGIGGGGKTRLAIRVAAASAERFPDGAWFVDLGPLAEPGRVMEAVAASLDVREVAGGDLGASVRERVRGRRMLVVLDNCEHLLAESAEIADALLTAGESVHVLATSREGLGLAGERLVAVRSLALPAPEQTGDLAAVAASEAVRLFVEGARRVHPTFALDAHNASTVAQICRRLDGIPLAIELASARVKHLAPELILERLDDRFRLLTGGSRTALPRHQTLAATMQWSHDQLDADERRLLRRLAVFAGGWTLAMAVEVAGEGDAFEGMEQLAHLVDKSLVLVEHGSGGGSRYGMLETVRQYARERLDEAGESRTLRERHLAAFLALAERAYAERIEREEAWSAALEAEHDNLRAALDAAHAHDPERYLALAGALGWWFQARSHALEGRAHLLAALDGASGTPPRRAWARALWSAANLMSWQGDTAAARPRMEEALRVWRALGDDAETALALEGLGWTQILNGEDDASRESFEECLRLQEALGDEIRINRALVGLTQALVALHRVERASAFAHQIVAFSSAHGDRRSEHFGHHFLADCALIEERFDAARRRYGTSLALARALGDRLETGFELQGIAMAHAGMGTPTLALVFAGAVEAEFERLGIAPSMRFWDALLERHLGAARAVLGATEAARAWAEGRALPFGQAADLASASAAD